MFLFLLLTMNNKVCLVKSCEGQTHKVVVTLHPLAHLLHLTPWEQLGSLTIGGQGS